MGLVAGIDAGTQSLKVLVYDPRTQVVVASASVPPSARTGGATSPIASANQDEMAAS